MHSDPFSSWMAGSRNGERQKKKDPEKGSWKEDLEHFAIRFCNEFRRYQFGGGQNCSRQHCFVLVNMLIFIKEIVFSCNLKAKFCNYQLEV